MARGEIDSKEEVNLLNGNVRSYIPSLEDEDVGKISVVEGKLYLLASDEFEMEAAKNQKMEVMDSGVESESSVASRIEEKAIESMVKNSGELVEIGEKLISKSVFEAWKIVNEFDDDKKIKETYGDGWYYIKKGTNIDGLGNLKKGYIINFTKDEVIIFDDNKHLFLDSKDKLAVTDNIVLNIDPSSLSDEEAWGSNVELHGVKNFNDFCKGTELDFDGVDDYIEIKVGDTEINEGLTLEFYGKCKGNNGFDLLSKTLMDDNDPTTKFRSFFGDKNTFHLCAGLR